MISVGGYNHSAKFSDAVVSADSRRRFAQSCVQFMKQNGFEGIDIDWELPVRGGMAGNAHRPEDKQNFTAMLAELRRQLDTQGASDGQHYLLTIAAPIAPSEYGNIEVNTIAQYLDWFNLESYAFYTASSPTTNFNAPLYASSSDPSPNSRRLYLNADAAVRGYLAIGVPASKLLIGVPFYGRGWQGVPNVNHGLYQSDSGAATDSKTAKGTWSDGAILYGELEKYYLNSYPRYWNEETKEPWLYNPSTGIMITYEDSQSLAAKADYVVANRLGGIMIWHVSADDAQHTLVTVLITHLQP
jgi:chitinase